MSGDKRLLLDTCAIIFIALDSGIEDEAATAISRAADSGNIFVSPISAWEVGMSMAKGRLTSPLTPLEFFRRFVDRIGAAVCELTPEVLIASSFLPGGPHGDPVDRMLVATARDLDMVLVTRDKPLLRYGREGHVKALAC